MLQRPSWYQQTSRVSLKSSTEAVLLLDMLIETERGGGGGGSVQVGHYQGTTSLASCWFKRD